MEIIVEILLQIVLWVLQVFCELFLELFGEVIAELIGHRLKKPFRRSRPPNPWLTAFSYLLFGAIAGAVSLWLLPAHFIAAPWLRIVNLCLTPVLAGIAMASIGAWRQKRGQEIIRLDTFFYGFCFALAMALVRFIWGH